jgi:predicted AlkP superfamily phosphohydrolase/phosphomutase
MKTIIVGFDAFDPVLFERLYDEGKLPHLGKYVEKGGYARFQVSNPPQSEVSWTSIATGLNPGGHGIFDFVHRNPKTYGSAVSLLPTKSSAVGTQFIPPHQAQTLFEEAVQDGYQATSLWWPATFPARFESPVRTIPGLGAPDILGRLGVGILFTADPEGEGDKRKTQVEKLEKTGEGEYRGWFTGPTGKTLSGMKETKLEINLKMTGPKTGKLQIEKQSIELETGSWSSMIEVVFKVGFGVSIRGITRAILNTSDKAPKIYFLPLQIHPLHSAWRYGTPKGFVKDLWKAGPFLTLGWPQDTSGLEEGCISEEQFLALCDQIREGREQTFMHLLSKFKEGVLACVFDSLDRVQHMFWKHRPEIIEGWYQELDSLLGRIEDQIAVNKMKDAHLLVVSDHGFKDFNYKVNLNRWLVDQGFLTPKEKKDDGSLKEVDWSKSQAYAIGLNSLYLNIEGREGQGIIEQGQKTEIIENIRKSIGQWKGPDGKSVVQNVYTQEEAYEGPFTQYGPDLVVGYAEGYRASAETGLGEWKKEAIEPNQDHWGGDHCMDPSVVPGVLFSNKGLKDYPNPSYADFPKLAIGKQLSVKDSAPPPSYSDEDQEVLEERLKDLGYL